MMIHHIRFFLNRLQGRETVLNATLVDRPVRVAIDSRRELKRLRKMENERPLVERIWDHLSAGDTIYDIGANIGMVSLLLAKDPAGKECHLHCFEPEPRNFRQLSRNIELNGLTGRMTPHALALGAVEGEVELHLVKDETGSGCHSIAKAERSCRSIRVPLFTADAMVRAEGRPPQVVKIDVEGAEGQVLAGMEETLRSGVVRDIFLEIHDKGDGDKMPNGETIHDWLAARGYALAWSTERSHEQHRHYRAAGVPSGTPA
jgi:FkbM family methyltransferase